MKYHLLSIALLAGSASSWAQCPESLALARFAPSATATPTVVLFAGGNDGSSSLASAVVDLYHTGSGLWTQASLSNSRLGMGATSVADRAFFAGGGRWSGQFQFLLSDVVDVYDSNSGTWTVETLSQPRMRLAATSLGSLALFAGGRASGQPPFLESDVVDIYDSAAGTWSSALLSQGRHNLSAASAGRRALFAGGRTGGQLVATVDIYDGLTGLWSVAQLSVAREDMAATALGSRVYFAGGTQLVGTAEIPSDAVDVYDTLTGLWTVLQLSAPRTGMSATTVGGRVLFGGGLKPDGGPSALVDVLENGSWSTQTLLEPRHGLAAASVVGEALFAGGSGAFAGQQLQFSATVERFTAGFPMSYCFGDTANLCPCGNIGGSGAGCANSTGVGARLTGFGCTTVSDDSFVLSAQGLPAGSTVLLFSALDTLGGGAGVLFGDGLLCAGGGIQRLALSSANASGEASWGPGLVAANGWSAGSLRRFQCWYRDSAGPCSLGFNLSNGVEASFAP